MRVLCAFFSLVFVVVNTERIQKVNGRGFSFSAKLKSYFSLSCALSLLLMTHDK